MGWGGEEGKDNPEVVSWGTWNMGMLSAGQRIEEKHIWSEVSPALDIARCLKDIHWRGLVVRLHMEVRNEAQARSEIRSTFVEWLWSSRTPAGSE